jgi:hypothetical protein
MSDTFSFLGMDFDSIHRGQQEIVIEASKGTRITWESALRAASRFAEGRACSPGKGSEGETANYPAESRREGSFNVCFWIGIEGLDTQWVVRFPKPVAADSLIQMKLRSEVATMRFLQQKTRVPVPQVIGYNEGDNELPPFMITTNVDGMRLGILNMIDLQPKVLDSLLRSLGGIQLELLSHPFQQIGMLDLPSDGDFPIITPFSLDELEHCRDNVLPVLHPPFAKASYYYNYKIDVWTRRLREQRNPINSYVDGRRKFINGDLIREFISRSGGPRQEDGPFYLVHPDLHGKNIIIERGTWTVKAIIDWEGTCILPLDSALNPPKGLCNMPPNGLAPYSSHFLRYQDRLRRYAKQFSNVAQYILDPKLHVSETLPPTSFLTWALDDVRNLDQIVWQHIVPQIYTEVQQAYDSILQHDNHSEIPVQAAIEARVNEFVDTLYHSGRYNSQEIDPWITRKLEDLQRYLDDVKEQESVVLASS